MMKINNKDFDMEDYIYIIDAIESYKIKLVKLLTEIVKSVRHNKNTMATIIAVLILQLDLSNT